MNAGMTERELLDRIARLPREILPPRDPWLAIAGRLDEPAPPARAWAPGWLPRAVAALAVLAVALGVVFSGADRRAPASAGPALTLAAPPMIAGSEAEYLAAFREFLPLGDARDALSAVTVATIEDSWSAMVRTEEALRVALAASPDDPFLNQRMLELRARQLGFLRQLAVLDHSNRRMSI
jgi:hypothetical protein